MFNNYNIILEFFPEDKDNLLKELGQALVSSI